MARLILRTGVIPEEIDEDTDDEAIEAKLEAAIGELSGRNPPSSGER